MQFKDLKKPELLEICEEFGVDVAPTMNKAFILTELFENGVTESLYLAAHPELAEDYVEPEDDESDYVEPTPLEKPKTKKKVNQILIRMQRENPTFEIQGYRFTREHPFALVDEDDVDVIVENNEGFRQATPKEAAEYYS